MAIELATTIPARVTDMTGRRFGRLVVHGYSRPHPKKGHFWTCKCDCGASSEHEVRNLIRGETKSCGCLRREATGRRVAQYWADRTPTIGFIKSNHRSYSSYSAMLSRCYNENTFKYIHYGGRGITVCDRWRHGESGFSGFQCFLLDMGPRPEGRSIDRIDNDGNYEPGNCRWATPKEQANNKRRRVRQN